MPDNEVILGQAVATEHGLRDKTLRQWTNDLVRPAQNKDLVQGLSKKDEPLEGQVEQPPQGKLVQVNAETMIADARELLGHLFDVTATKDYGNTRAAADVIVKGKVLISDAPVPYLLFLEDMINEMITELSKVQVRPLSDDWNPTDTPGLYRTDVVRTPRLAKFKEWRAITQPTQWQQAEVREVTEDKQAGTWIEYKMSGALPADRKKAILDHLRTLKDAVQYARVQANTTKIPEMEVSKPLFDYAFDGKLPE
jgi:hypothetical protein